MFGTFFYNETMKRAVSIFGTVFNNITVKKIKEDGTVLHEQKVPISYGPKQKFLARLQQEADLSDNNRSAISLPRLAFELTGFEYDATRQQNKLLRHSKSQLETSDGNKRGYQYQPAPYNLNFTLNVLAKNMNDALQIVEQILPYFQPEYTVTMKMVDSMSDIRDVPIQLTSVNMEDTYEGDFTERRVISYALEFTMKLYFFGPVYTGDVIKSVVERDYINQTSGTFTTTQIDGAGLVKEVKHYEPAFAEIVSAANDGTSTTYTFANAINSKISVGDEVFGFRGAFGNVVVATISDDRRTITTNEANAISEGETLKFVGSVQPNDTFVVAENVTFYDDGTISTFADDKVTDAS